MRIEKCTTPAGVVPISPVDGFYKHDIPLGSEGDILIGFRHHWTEKKAVFADDLWLKLHVSPLLTCGLVQ